MTVIRPNSVSGITSITAQANEINVFRSNGLLAGLNLNGVNFNTTAGISTLAALKVTGNLDVEGVLTYQDVTNVDSLGIGTFRTGINVSGGQLDVGSNIKLGNAGVITATSFVGSGANLTGIALTSLNINGNTNNRIITATGNQYSAQGESRFTFDGNTAEIGDQSSNSTSTLIVSRGEIISGGTGPVIQLKHGPSSGTQRTHQIYSHVGDLVVQADSNENLKIETGGRESIRITSNSDMGLSNTGTNNPNSYSNWCTFTINGTAGAEIDFEKAGTLQADILCGQAGLLYTNRLDGDNHTFATHDGTSVANRFTITNQGNLNQSSSGGGSYFTGSSEYTFGSTSSSPPAGGAEAKFQVHDYKTRATMSLNAYMNNAGGPTLQFLSSRSGTPGTLGTKSALNDYHGDIRFAGDNGTNYNSVVYSGQIMCRQKSTISDGDSVCAGELSFWTGSGTGGSITERLTITTDKVMTSLDIKPNADGTLDLGASGTRWANIYTSDIDLSNESKKDKGGNEVDGTWGSYTIQEGENDLFLLNRRNGKKYKFNLTEVL